MFILRTIGADNTQFNDVVGDSYVLVHKNFNKEQFEREKSNAFGVNSYEGECYAILKSGKLGRKPLFKGVSYLVMASDGNVFDNLSLKTQ